MSLPVSALQIEGVEVSGEGDLVTFSLGNQTSDIVSEERLMDLKTSLVYLQNVMTCIDAALAGDFSGLTVSKAVPAEEFMMMLNKIMLGLSQDNTNIDILYFDFILLEIEGEISEYHVQSLLRLYRQML